MHQDHISDRGYASGEWFALIHTPIPMSQAMKIPAAKAKVDALWEKHTTTKRTWMLDSVLPRKKVIAEAKALKKIVHFGTIMDLCHEKHSELQRHIPVEKRGYKGRGVFRGDTVKDEDGFYAVFSEQGSSKRIS